MARKPPTKRSVLILARTITAIASLTLAEGLLWFRGYPNWRVLPRAPSDAKSEFEPDPDLGWKNSEGEYLIVGPGRPFRYTNWTRGRRATSAQKPLDSPTRPRVYFFGDSYVYGYGLGDVDTFAWHVQQRHPELQVNNYGTPGYGTYQSYIAMKRELPGAEYVFYMLNGFHEDRNVGDPSWIRVPRRDNSHFFPFAALAGGELEPRRSYGDQIWFLSYKLRIVALAEEYYEMAEARKRVHQKRAVTQTLLLRMDQLAQSAGAKFTVILFDLWPKDREVYRPFLTSHHIAFLDCDHSELSDKSLRLPDGHPNQKLNELLSQWIDSPAALAQASAPHHSE